jgi:serine phosphatase RsbU (regulator of sigma subunit)
VPAAATTAPRRHAPAPTEQRSRASRVARDVAGLVRALPAAVLWALIGTGALALALAANAFSQSRRRAALERQRTLLLDDIGLLSSALLPPVPQTLDGLTVSAAYRPAEGPAAGGDFYDVFALDDERIGVLLGDVSGHGRASVSHAALARYTLRTLLAAGHSPGDALARADRLLARELPPDFVTVIAAVYDHRTGELAYAKAGHAPPIVLGAPHDGAAEPAACPIGLGLGKSWPEFRLDLCEGVTVGLVTDGLEDARTGRTRLGREQVERLLAEQEIPDASVLLGDVRELADTLPDDTAAVVLHRATPSAV